MRLSMEVSGLEVLGQEMKEILDEAGGATTEALLQAAMMVHGEAVSSIQAHLSSGRTYRRRGIEHTASAPGYPPNSDRGTLVQSIQFEADDEEAVVGTNLKYGEYLEFGTSKMEARPWLFPALDNNRDQIQDLFLNILREAI